MVDKTTRTLSKLPWNFGTLTWLMLLVTEVNDNMHTYTQTCQGALVVRHHINPKGRGSFKKFVRECACQTSKFWLTLYLFSSPLTIHLYTNFVKNKNKNKNKKNLTIFLKLCAVNDNLLKIYPIRVNWAPSSVMKTHPSLSNIHRKSPQEHHRYT